MEKTLELDDIVAVHCTNYLPVDRIIRTLGNHKTMIDIHQEIENGEKMPFRIPRETLHFSLNGAHGQISSTNGSGDWTKMKYGILIPLSALRERLAVLQSADSYIIGNYLLNRGSEIVVDVSQISEEEKRIISEDKALKDVTFTEKPSNTSLKDFIYQKIRDGGYLARDIGMWGWNSPQGVDWMPEDSDLFELAKREGITTEQDGWNGTNRLAGISPHSYSNWAKLENSAGLLATEIKKRELNKGFDRDKARGYLDILIKSDRVLKRTVKPVYPEESEAMDRISSVVRPLRELRLLE